MQIIKGRQSCTGCPMTQNGSARWIRLPEHPPLRIPPIRHFRNKRPVYKIQSIAAGIVVLVEH